ncbi:hypothetical protein [Candidatus Venteria ishoeyi]|uniref:Uncharacterized protein n=1 Tax=Candidatus Venteria ishoeyi TaxID=1899563 RepID=A0A1H6FDA2_9GAMM|nr:hypothetical protein [Candidatus Venteria ishoeyi]MDM8546512.1 hypothetical protein [Candidatus Venteria ishoeyi]SEH07299.1 Uncharacterised protein [Candidatus Venteria ishoeyi]
MLSMDDIKQAVSNLVNLDIRTVVGDFTYDRSGKIQPASDAKQIVTRINLLDGDITTAFSEEFLSTPLENVRGFHGVRERQGMEIMQGNIKALQQLTDLIGNIESKEKKVASEAAGEVPDEREGRMTGLG